MKFRMIDRIIDWESRKYICGIKALSFEEYNLKTALGFEPHLPESLLMESLFQLGNWLIMLSSDFSRVGLLVRIQKVSFIDLVRPGETLRLEAEVRSYRNDGIVFDGRAFVADKLISMGEGCLAAPVDLDDYYNPDDLRVLYSEIYRPLAGKTS